MRKSSTNTTASARRKAFHKAGTVADPSVLSNDTDSFVNMHKKFNSQFGLLQPSKTLEMLKMSTSPARAHRFSKLESLTKSRERDLETIDANSFAEASSSEDSDMGDYDIDIKTQKIVKTNKKNDAASNRSAATSRRKMMKKSATIASDGFSMFGKSSADKSHIIKMLVKRESKRLKKHDTQERNAPFGKIIRKEIFVPQK